MSYYGTPINESPTIVIQAGAAITAPAFLAIKADGTVAGAGEHALGIAHPCNDAAVASGDDLTIQIKDIGTWIAGGAVAKGAELASDANEIALESLELSDRLKEIIKEFQLTEENQ